METDFGNHRIGDVVNVTDYVANGSFAALKNNVEYRDEPDYAVLIRLVDFNSGWNGDYVYVTRESYEFLSKSSLENGDVIISNVGANAGTVFRAPDIGRPMTLGPNSIVLKTGGNKHLKDYLYYYFVSRLGQLQIQSIIGGSAQPKFNKTDFRSLYIPIPESTVTQNAIAHILGTLDDKIELNRQMNATLEAMAQALFKSWFVDFDPVIDNVLAAGNPIPEPLQARAEARKALGDQRKPLPEAIQNQFPDRFVFNDELGWVPEGWKRESIYSLIDVVYGAPFKSKEFNSGITGLPVIRIRDLKTGLPQVWTEEVHPKGTLIQRGDLLVGMDAEFRATLWPGDDGWLNQRVFKAEPKNKNSNAFFVQMVLKPLLAQEENAQVGTTVAHLGKKDIDRFTWLCPSTSLIGQFSRQVNGYLSRWVNIHEQTSTLARLRDTLLPKLLSGQLRVPDAEQLTARVS